MEAPTIDLFECIESLPEKVQETINLHYNEETETYTKLISLGLKLYAQGYTFEYGLDGIPYNLTKITENAE